MRPDERIGERLAELERRFLRREYPGEASGAGSGRSEGGVDARSNDYLGLAGRPVSRETLDALIGSGGAWGAGAARLVSGTNHEHVELERELADWLGAEAALLFSSAYAANVGALSALAGRGDVVFSDELNHASIIDGCRLSRANVVVLPHLDLTGLERKLREQRLESSQAWVVTETYFGMDADSPDLVRLRELCDEHDAGLVVDEAHALGVFGGEGQGLCSEAGVKADVVVGGMGKALGVQGGFVAGARVYVEWLWNRARTFVFSTAPSPLLTWVVRQRLAEVRAGDAARRQLRAREAQLAECLQEMGIELPSGRHGPIFPLVLGTEAAALRVSARARQEGVRAQPIRPPTVPGGTSRLRVSVRADMTEAQVRTLASVLARAIDTERAQTAPGAGGQPPFSPAPVIVAPGAVEREPAPEPDTAKRRTLGLPTWPTLPRVAGASGPARSDTDWGGRRELERWIILGTGTGVGKTHVATGLVQLHAGLGRAVAGLKPIETGYELLSLGRGSDAERLERASFHVKHPQPHPLYAFADPVTPALAARRQGNPIDLPCIAEWVNRLSTPASHSPVVVLETAGGVFSPLGLGITNHDLALALGPARWVLTALDRLGVLHEIDSTLRAMRALGTVPECIVLNAPAEPDASTGTNADELRHMGVLLPIIELPRNITAPLAQLLSL